MIKIRRGRAVWLGDRHGSGRVTTASGTLSEASMSQRSRFGDEPGANPEELIAAAHAGCFAMDVAIALTDLGFDPVELRVTADVTLASEANTVFIASSHIELVGIADDIPYNEFKSVVDHSLLNCPVSRLLRASITADWILLTTAGIPVAS